MLELGIIGDVWFSESYAERLFKQMYQETKYVGK